MVEIENTIQFTNPDFSPTEDSLEEVLRKGFSLYKQLIEFTNKNNLINEWKYYKDGKAWLCKVQKKKTTIIWMSAWKGYIQATVYIQEKYLDNIYALDLNKDQIDKIVNTKNVGKLKPCTFDILSVSDLEDLLKVTEYKLSIV